MLPTYGSILRLRDQWPSTPPSLLDSDRVAHERGLLQGAVSLLDSSNTRSRHLSSVFLANLTMEDDSLQTCKVLHGMGAAEKGLNLLKSQAEDAQTHLALLHMLVNLQTHEQLPHKTLLRAGLQHCLVGLLNAPGATSFSYPEPPSACISKIPNAQSQAATVQPQAHACFVKANHCLVRCSRLPLSAVCNICWLWNLLLCHGCLHGLLYTTCCYLPVSPCWC